MTPDQAREYTGLIGGVCSHWAHLEYQIAKAIWTLLNVDDPTGKIITGSFDIESRCGMACRLARHLKAPEAAIDGLEAILNDIQEMIGERNLAVHGVYGLDPLRGKFAAEVHRGKFRNSQQPMSIIRARTLMERMYQTTKKMDAVLNALGLRTELPPEYQAWLDKFSQQAHEDRPSHDHKTREA